MKTPKIVLTRRVRLALKYAVEYDTKLEVSGLGKTSLTPDGDIYVSDIIIPPQEVSGGGTDIDGDMVLTVTELLAKKGEKLSDWRLWWHSHNTMSAFFSSTDNDTIEDYAEMVDWAAGLVVNVKGERKAKIVMARPFALEFETEAINTVEEDSRIKEWVDTAMEFVKKRPPLKVVDYRDRRAAATNPDPPKDGMEVMVNGQPCLWVDGYGLIPMEVYEVYTDTHPKSTMADFEAVVRTLRKEDIRDLNNIAQMEKDADEAAAAAARDGISRLRRESRNESGQAVRPAKPAGRPNAP